MIMRYLANCRLAKNETIGCRTLANCMKNDMFFIYVNVNYVYH